MPDTFYWHDYETFGADPSRDRPAQFAGLRTDMELNVIGDPLVLFARPAPDMLPHPEACLITGITPQQALEEGVHEAEFIRRIHAELSRPGTCGVGYNNIRFDDEITRYTLYRNFHDPYEHTWRDGNSRWDIIDMVRLTYALRPDGIEWPQVKGRASFRLELLTKANGIDHASAHDALSDVHATIGLAALIRARQPRLFEYALGMRDKRQVLAQLDVVNREPVLHVSAKFGAARHNIALVSPVARHPVNHNEIICFDLSADPAPLAELDADALRERLFASKPPAGEKRPGLKSIHVNRSPMVATPDLLDAATAERLGLDVARCHEHHRVLAAIPDLADKLEEVYRGRGFPETTDPDRALYSGGFFSDADKRVMDEVRAADPEELRDGSFAFEDSRLPTMLFRYRARNYPDSLTPVEQQEWEEFRRWRLTDPAADAGMTLDRFHEELESLRADPALPADKRALLDRLEGYAEVLFARGGPSMGRRL